MTTVLSYRLTCATSNNSVVGQVRVLRARNTPKRDTVILLLVSQDSWVLEHEQQGTSMRQSVRRVVVDCRGHACVEVRIFVRTTHIV